MVQTVRVSLEIGPVSIAHIEIASSARSTNPVDVHIKAPDTETELQRAAFQSLTMRVLKAVFEDVMH